MIAIGTQTAIMEQIHEQEGHFVLTVKKKVTGDVPDSLYGTGVLDNTVVRAAVRTESLTGCRYIKRDEIVVLEDLNALIVASCAVLPDSWMFS